LSPWLEEVCIQRDHRV